MNLLISFKAGQYSSLKVKFKAIFSKHFKWNGENWRCKDGYVEPTEKMESGAAVTFRVESDNEMFKKFVGFCVENKIEFKAVDGFDEGRYNLGLPCECVKAVGGGGDKVVDEFKVDRVPMFVQEGQALGLSDGFIDRWSELLKVDDDKLNKKPYITMNQ